MTSKTKLVFLLSDLHIGSTVALWPEGFISNEGNPIGQNKFQEWLWKCWNDMLGWAHGIIGKDEFEFVLNGDTVEGIHHKTLQVMTPDVGDQTDAVKLVIGDLCRRATRFHFIKGTECHTRNDEIRLGRFLGATRDPITGQNAWDMLDLEVNGLLYNFAHHVGVTSKGCHEAGEHSRNLADISHCRARTKKRVPDIVCRAHRHRHGIWDDGNQISVVTGAWQGLTRHGNKVVPNAIPQPSAVIFDSRGIEKGRLPIIRREVWTAK